MSPRAVGTTMNLEGHTDRIAVWLPEQEPVHIFDIWERRKHHVRARYGGDHPLVSGPKIEDFDRDDIITVTSHLLAAAAYDFRDARITLGPFPYQQGSTLSVDTGPLFFHGTVTDLLVETRPNGAWSLRLTNLNDPQDGDDWQLYRAAGTDAPIHLRNGESGRARATVLVARP